jgi:SAM-dependent methyltransferase
MPADALFEDSRLASLYDPFNGWDICDAFYYDLAREIGGTVLDLGCGTGLLACRIAEQGLHVIGVDPAEGMLRIARARGGGDRVTWIKASGQALQLDQRFDLIYMTGHAFQALLTDDDAVALLRAACNHLTRDGRLAFDTRNPARKAWLGWTPDKPRQVATAEHGEVEERIAAAADPQTGIVDLTHLYQFAASGETIVGRSRIRFVARDHLERLLALADLTPVAWYGDWDRSPVGPASPELIVVARRSD